jgi:hypothetical protein
MAVSTGTSRHTVTSTRPGDAGLEAGGWLTTVLRPAGTLDRLARRRLSRALGRLTASCDMVVVDLTATQVEAPRALARNLRACALELERSGRCLLLVGASLDLVAELDRTAVPVATLAAGSLLLPAASSADRVNGRDRSRCEAGPARRRRSGCRHAGHPDGAGELAG